MNSDDISRIRGKLASATVADMLDIAKSQSLWLEQIKLGVLGPNSTIPFDMVFDYKTFDLLEQQRFQVPENTTINGSLILKNFDHLTSLPPNLKVAKDLELRGARLKELPSGLVVGGILDLMGNAFSVTVPSSTRAGIWMEGGN